MHQPKIKMTALFSYVWGFCGSDYEECSILGYTSVKFQDNAVITFPTSLAELKALTYMVTYRCDCPRITV
jgi:hypothetical protein